MIELTGSNSITSTCNAGQISAAVSSDGALTIKGPGSLAVTGGDAPNSDISPAQGSYGLHLSSGPLTIDGATVTAQSGVGAINAGVSVAGPVNLKNRAALTACSTTDESVRYSFGVFLDGSNGKLTFTGTGNTLTAKGKTTAVNLPGGEIEKTAGKTLTASADYGGAGADENTFTFDSSETAYMNGGGYAQYVNVAPKTQTYTDMIDFTASDAPSEGAGFTWDKTAKILTLDNFHMNLVRTVGGEAWCGIYLPSGSTIALTEGTTNTVHISGDWSYDGGAAILVNTAGQSNSDLIIQGSGTLNAGSGAGHATATGAHTISALQHNFGTLIIKDDAKVNFEINTTPESGENPVTTYGLRLVCLRIEGGTVTVNAVGAADKTIGIGLDIYYASYGTGLHMTGGKLLATGSTKAIDLGADPDMEMNQIGLDNVAVSGSLEQSTDPSSATKVGEWKNKSYEIDGAPAKTVYLNFGGTVPVDQTALHFGQNSAGNWSLYTDPDCTEEYTEGKGSTWSVNSGTLTLSGFIFESPSTPALTLADGTVLVLAPESENRITSTSDADGSCGIEAAGLTVNGTGSLAVTGKDVGLNALGALTVNSGSMTAAGGVKAVNASGGAPTLTGVTVMGRVSQDAGELANLRFLEGTYTLDGQNARYVEFKPGAITVEAQPGNVEDAVYGEISGALTATGSATGGGAVSYQWYSAMDADKTGAEAIPDATGADFVLPAGLDAGTYYYFCRLSAAGCGEKDTSVAVVTVNQAVYPGTTTGSASVRAGTATSEKTFILPELPDGASYGAAVPEGALIDGVPTVDGTTLTYSTTSQESGVTGVITVPVTGAKNYQDYSFILTVTAASKDEAVISGLTAAAGLVYTGGPQIGYTGSAAVTGGVDAAGLTYRYEGTDGTVYGPSAEAPADAGSYRLTVAVPESNPDYTGSLELSFVIQRAPVTFSVTNDLAQQDGTPQYAAVSATANGTGFTAFTTTYRQGETVVAEPTATGSYDIYAEITDQNYRHSDGVGGAARKIGALTIIETTPPATYTVDFSGGDGATGSVPPLAGAAEGTVRIFPANGFTKGGWKFMGWNYGGRTYQPGDTFQQPGENVTVTAVWQQLHTVSGIVTQLPDGTPVVGAVIRLMLGSAEIARTVSVAGGAYSFTDVTPGAYNLIAAKDGITHTILVTLSAADLTGKDIVLPAGKTNSSVEVEVGAPAIVVGNLDQIFNDNANYTDGDKATVAGGGSVEIKLSAKVAGVNSNIESEAGSSTEIALYLDLDLTKIVKDKDNALVGAPSPITETASLLSAVVQLPGNLQNQPNYAVYREHNGVVDRLTSNPNADGEYIELNVEKTAITIHAKKFSTYGIAISPYLVTFDANGGSCATADAFVNVQNKLDTLPTAARGGYAFDGWFTAASGGDKVTLDKVYTANTTLYAHWSLSGGTSGGGGGGSSSSKNTVDVPSFSGGSVSVSPQSAAKGTLVTLTVTPDDGRELESLTVTDKNGAKLELTGKGGGMYTFTMPDSKVSVNAVFAVKRGETAAWQNPFNDVKEGAWYYEAVKLMNELGLMDGTSASAFSPDITTTRGMIVTILYRMEGLPSIPGEGPAFTDIPDGQYYTDAVAWASANGVVKGYSDGRFGPDDLITREQMAAILYRCAQYKGRSLNASGDLSGFTDQPSGWAAEAMKWAVGNGIITGKSSGTLDPGGSATRAEAAVMLQRFLDLK